MAMKPGILSLVGLVGVLLACSAACGAMEEKPGSPGEAIFWDQCVMCHGRMGDLKMSGAKDLTKSALTKGEMIAIVTNGKAGMIGYGERLSKKEVEEVVDHVRSLHEVARSDN